MDFLQECIECIRCRTREVGGNLDWMQGRTDQQSQEHPLESSSFGLSSKLRRLKNRLPPPLISIGTKGARTILSDRPQ